MGAPRSGLVLGYVTGTTPDRWVRAWQEQGRGSIALVRVTETEQEERLRAGELDMALVRLPVGGDGLHVVRLYDELPVVVAGREHLIVAASDAEDGLLSTDLDGEQLVRPHASGWQPVSSQLPWPEMDERTAIETVAAGTGVVIMPMSVARLHQRRDVVHRVVRDLPSSTVALAWRIERDDDVTQAFVGVVRGRTGRSSR